MASRCYLNFKIDHAIMLIDLFIFVSHFLSLTPIYICDAPFCRNLEEDEIQYFAPLRPSCDRYSQTLI